MSFQVETIIACSPEKAFDLAADVRNEAKWNSNISRSELLADEPIGLGSRFAVVWRGKPYESEIAAYERPSSLQLEITGEMDITATFGFRPKGEATSFASEFDIRPKGAMKLLFPLMRPIVGRDFRKQVDRFKVFCERTTPPV